MKLAGLVAVVVACSQPRAEERTRTPALAEASGSGFEAQRAVAASEGAVAGTSVTASTPSCVDDGKPYDPNALVARLSFLASAELDGRAPGTAGDRAARAHIVARFRCLGLTPAGDGGGYEQAFLDSSKQTTANVIGYIAGSDPDVGSEIIVVGAHHDHLGDGHLGANDNASGVTALLAIAQWVKQKDVAPKRTLAFMTFGAEEHGMVGSNFYVEHPATALPLAKIVQVINLDMVGSHSSKGFVAAMGAFANMPSRKLLAKLETNYPKLNVGIGGRARGSDYEPFCEIGIPYVFFWTPDKRCYHKACDTVAAIDLPRMADIAALAGDLTWGLASSTTDLAAARTKLRCYGR